MLAQAFVHMLGVVEAEGRLFQQKVLQTSSVLLLMSLAFLFWAVTFMLILAALYQSFILWWSLPLAYLATAIASLILAGGMSWISYRIVQKQ